MTGKSSKAIQTVLLLAMFVSFGGIIGYSTANVFFISEMSLWVILSMYTVLFILFILIIILQVIIHEMGHLVFGLLTGYQFVSFRVFSWMIVKSQGKFQLKKFKLVGTGGQCLLSPPDYDNGNYPALLYNFGGPLFNFITVLIAFIGTAFAEKWSISYILLLLFVIVGLYFTLSNAIPMMTDEISNDGYNALSISKDQEAKKALWVQLKVNALSSKGVRLKDMASEYFEMPKEPIENPMVATVGVFRANRLLDQQHFEETRECINELIGTEVKLNGLHELLLINDLIFIEAILNQLDNSGDLLDKKQKKTLKAMNNLPPILRTNYAARKLIKNNESEAAKILLQFNKIAQNYPSPADIESERELIEIVDKTASELN